MAGACITSAALPTPAPAQGLPPLTQTLTIEDEGITISYPEGWSAAQQANVYTLFNVPAEQLDSLDAAGFDAAVRCTMFRERRTDHAEAVRRLKEIEAEADSPSTFLEIGGWPALQRRHLMPKPRPGQDLPVGGLDEMILLITTAVAANDLLVRLECVLPEDLPPEIADLVEAIGRSMAFANSGDPAQVNQDIQELRASPLRRPATRSLRSVPSNTLPEGSGPPARLEAALSEAAAGASVRVTNQAGVDSELEIAVSTDGRNIVIGSNASYHFSNDGGQTWNQTVGPSATSDPSLAFGLSGTFYAANISGNATAIDISTDNGQTFNFQANAFVCPATGANQCGAGFPDQEHIAADRFNAASGQNDQVYSAWRHLTALGWGIVCSADSGTSWGNLTFTAGDFPRITVGRDGFVYVVYRSGADIMLNKFDSCDNGLNQQMGFPTAVVTGISDVACPVPGLDRCNNGNLLSSHMVAVDDTDPDHIYVAYAVNTAFDGMTSLGNENVLVQDSLDGGETWPPERLEQVNDPAVEARRYMPWVCATNGTAFVSWYDRRDATAANNDLTDFFGGSAFLDGLDELMVGTEFRVNEPDTSDANCAAGQPAQSFLSWPFGTRNPSVMPPGDSESCIVQGARAPQLAGRCCAPGALNFNNATCPAGSGSGNACDFSDAVGGGVFGCPSGETCQPATGTPKYGDYNGNACIGGQFYTAWASATSPPDITQESSDIDIFFAAFAPNHFKSYRVATAPEFEPRDVSLEDQFGATAATVLRPYTLLNPVDKDGAATVDPTAHLKCYRIRDTGPRFERRDVAVRNQFGDQTLTLFRPWELCLPAEKDGVASDLNLDHFKCYRAVTAPRRPRFELREVLLEDQFEAKETLVRRPFTFCNPVSKDGGEIRDPKLHLTCYFIQDRPRLTRRDVFVEDQFGVETLTVFRSWTLCLPSTKSLL